MPLIHFIYTFSNLFPVNLQLNLVSWLLATQRGTFAHMPNKLEAFLYHESNFNKNLPFTIIIYHTKFQFLKISSYSCICNYNVTSNVNSNNFSLSQKMLRKDRTRTMKICGLSGDHFIVFKEVLFKKILSLCVVIS